MAIQASDANINTHLPYKLFRKHYQINNLNRIYQEKFASSSLRGTDRLSGIQFGKQLKVQARIINKKCIKGNYNFAPYLEKLIPKGRGKIPRIISIPTVRDRIVLHALKEILSSIFSDRISRKLANTHIHEIKKFINSQNINDFAFIKTDIENFYGSINRELLGKKLGERIRSRRIVDLINSAICNPTVPKVFKKSDAKNYEILQGIPQGLSISNILASIYLQEMDVYFDSLKSVFYCRYVDDILIIAKRSEIGITEKSLRDFIYLEQLKINKEKTACSDLSSGLEYLGYSFRKNLQGGMTIGVRESSKERFISSIISLFSDYRHSKCQKLKILKKHNRLITEEDLKSFFVLELNEKITGAISEKKRYGWIFYFNAIDDLTMLYQIDSIVRSMFRRMPDFNNVAPLNIKSLARALHESVHNPLSKYIHNYDTYETIPEKKKFLVERGQLYKTRENTDQEVERVFTLIRQKSLSKLEADESRMY